MLDTAAVSAAPAACGTAALIGGVSALFGDAEVGANWPTVAGQFVLGLASLGTALIAMLSARDRLRFDATNAAREAELKRLAADNTGQAGKIAQLEGEVKALVEKTDACHDERDKLADKVAYLIERVGARDTADPLPTPPKG
jgi:hypothetical protein